MPEDKPDKTAKPAKASKSNQAPKPAKADKDAKEGESAKKSGTAKKVGTAKKGGTAKADAESPVVALPDAEAQGAENQLLRRLGVRTGTTGLVIAPPEDDDNPLLPLPEGFTVLAQLDDLASVDGTFDSIYVFARDRAALASAFATLRDKLAPNGSLWVSWMKLSGRVAGGTFGDLNETLIRRMALTHAMVDIKIAALDRDWSALRLVRRKH